MVRIGLSLTKAAALIVILNSLLLSSAMAQTQLNRFNEYYEQIYQVRVTSVQAGSKSSIGSGFQVSANGLIATNYHVVSDYVYAPNEHQVEFRSHTGEVGALELLDFDVINDIALLRIATPAERSFTLADTPSTSAADTGAKGKMMYALGNPRDFGVTLVQGFNNGLVEHSFNDQLLFSGSLNPGMSGGPTLDDRAEVIGINVATAGSQLSFLIPVDKLRQLIDAQRTLQTADYFSEIAGQIKAWQSKRLQGLLDSEWASETFAERELFGEIRKDFQCWGNTNSDDANRTVEWTTKSCYAANEVFLSSRLDIGQLHFSFTSQQSLKLNRFQFTQLLSPDMSADNQSNYEHSTHYQCEAGFLDSASEQEYHRINTCIRAHKKLPGLYDSLLSVEVVAGLTSFLAHLSISGAEPGLIKALNTKFIGHVL